MVSFFMPQRTSTSDPRRTRDPHSISIEMGSTRKSAVKRRSSLFDRQSTKRTLTPRERWKLATALVLAQGIRDMDSSRSPDGRNSSLDENSGGDSPPLSAKVNRFMRKNKSVKRRRWIEGVMAEEADELKDNFQRRTSWTHSTARADLEGIARKSHRYRLIYSGGLLAVGAILLVGFQVIGLVQSLSPSWSADEPPAFLWQMISMVAPAIMLLGIQPGDKLGIRLAAAFLSILCGYYFIFLISSPSNWATPFAQVRAVVLIFIEWFWGCLFLRAAKLRVSAGGSRENLKEGQLAFGRTTYFFMGSSRAA